MTRFRLAIILVVLALVPIEAQSRNYYHRRQGVTSNTITLDFKKMADENPLSFGGLFIQGLLDGTNWKNTRVSGGLVYGTQTGVSGLYDDSVTLIRGSWGTDYTVTGWVHIGTPQGGGCYEEMELWTRGDVRAGLITGYENAWRATTNAPYWGTTRWNGQLGTVGGCADGCAFDGLSNSQGVGSGLVDGDVIKVVQSSTVITATINGVPGWTYDTVADNPKYATGLPGFGHWYHNTNGNSCSNVPSDYGFTRITVTAP